MNSAGFSPDDVEDARRGAPTVELSGYALSRGLQAMPYASPMPGVFTGLLPKFKEYAFNLMRGPFPGNRYGMALHRLYDLPIDGSGKARHSGMLYGVRTGMSFRVDSIFGVDLGRTPEAFGPDDLLVPTTQVAVQCPEMVFLPRLVVTRVDHLGFRPRRFEGPASGFGKSSGFDLDDALWNAISAAVGPTLQTLPFPFVELTISQGRIGLVVNGFVLAAEVLDALVHAVSALADSLAQLCSPWHAPGPFDVPLPGFDPSGHPPGWPSAMFMGRVDNSLLPSLQEIATNLHASIEDPVAFHRRLPGLPMPGASLGVIAGRLPGTTAVGRLTWLYQNARETSAARRAGAVFAARPDAPPTPPGGVLVDATGMMLAVRDGLAACWMRQSYVGHFHSATVLETALATMRTTGVADV